MWFNKHNVSWKIIQFFSFSSGTAKQHIDMLEEHILSLEEDILTKDTEISDLESKLKVLDSFFSTIVDVFNHSFCGNVF